ncbi:MAG: aldehyde ferredoxin oxidoreductase family protein [Anaerovoracaceae bacterium]
MDTKYGGYMGKVLKIDLTTREISHYPFSDKERELFIGGKIMAAKILGDNLTGKETPFSHENMLVITTGPLTGTGAPSSSRFNISGLSPLTGLLASSNCGGSFGYFLKKAGYDGLILQGRSEEHIRIEIKNDRVSILNADDLWGLRTSEAQSRLPERTGNIVIGPAGENLVKYACICSQERVAGRAGLGALMGWMNLKAVTVSGNKTVSVHHQVKNKELNKKWFSRLRKHPLTGHVLPRMGTANLLSLMQMRGLLATRNFARGQFEEYEKVNGELLARQYNIVNKGCLSCPIRCARTVSVDGKEVKGPELETLCLLGAGILNNNLELVLRWNYELDELGMDTISAASTLAYAMEACEKGLWNNGLKFGETEEISRLWEDIAHRRGIGDELAEGSRWLSDKYGGKEFAINTKGMELSAYEPRRAVGQGLGYAVSNRGGCHLNGGYAVFLEGLGLAINPQTKHGKPDLTVMLQNLLEMLSATGQCLFISYAMFPGPLIKNPNSFYVKAVNAILPYLGGGVRVMNKFPLALQLHLPVFPETKSFEYVTGMKMRFGQYMRAGERGYTLERSINNRFGVDADADTLPERLTQTPQIENDKKTVVPLSIMKSVYYKARGWNEKGIPTVKTLKKLRLEGSQNGNG